MNEFVVSSIIIFVCGIYCMISKKNLIKLLIGLILMVESSHLIFITISPLNALAQYFVLISIVINSCLIATIISFIIIVYRKKGTLNTKMLDVS